MQMSEHCRPSALPGIIRKETAAYALYQRVQPRFKEEPPVGKAIIYSDNSRAAEVFGELLKEAEFEISAVRETIAFCGVDADIDLQLINAGENFDAAVKLAEKLAGCTASAVILVGDADNCAEKGASLRANGVIVVEKPLTKQMFIQSVNDAAAMLGRLKRMANLLEETRTIARAKLILVEQQHMTEQQAHKYIEREAMNRRITRLELAGELIAANT